MNQIFLFTTLLSVCAISFSALHDNSRYGASHGGNSLGYQGGHNRYPALPQAPRSPVHQSYGAPSNLPYGARHSAPVSPYGGGARHLGAHNAGLNRHSGPISYSGAGHYGSPGHHAGQSSYGAPAHHAPLPPHYASPKRSLYQAPASAYSGPSARSGYPQPQTYSKSHQGAQSQSQTHGREMKYTINDPHNKGTTHVSETHVVSNRQMQGAEAEAAMKKLMGSMGPGSDNGFQDLVKGMGLPFY